MDYGGLGNQAVGVKGYALPGSTIEVAKPRTISSAIGRASDLNGRLRELRGLVEALADQIGGPRPLAGAASDNDVLSQGAVGQLNDAVDHAHVQVNELEELIAAIGRALG